VQNTGEPQPDLSTGQDTVEVGEPGPVTDLHAVQLRPAIVGVLVEALPQVMLHRLGRVPTDHGFHAAVPTSAAP
jgi:hypothetical protein